MPADLLQALQISPPVKDVAIRAPDRGAVVFVLRTGFATTQGGLVRVVAAASDLVRIDSSEVHCRA